MSQFKYVLGILQSNIHKPPKDHQAECDFVIEILTKGQGYLTKEKPIRVVFFDSDAK
jgi:hypothetical protein